MDQSSWKKADHRVILGGWMVQGLWLKLSECLTEALVYSINTCVTLESDHYLPNALQMILKE